MVTADDVKKLATLARVSVSEAELPKFTSDFEAIVAYVGQLEKLDLGTASGEREVPAQRNVFRPDENETPAGTWTEKMASAFPKREGDTLVVKQIISHD